MRLSVDKTDPGYAPYGKLLGDGKMVTIMLDGVRQDMVISVDDTEGWVRKFHQTPDGRVARGNGEMLVEDVHGKVEIIVSGGFH